MACLPIPSQQDLEELYLQRLLSDEEIGRLHKVSASSVRRWRRKYKILSRSRGPRVIGRTKTSDEQVTQAVKESTSVGGVCRLLGVCESGTGFINMRERVSRLGLDTSHFGGNTRVLGGEGHRKPLGQYLTLNSPRLFSRKKLELISLGLLKEICAKCTLGPSWNGQRLTLQLDHLNGDRSDNRLENLRLLCPNCHTQTGTFAGRNKRRTGL